MLPLCAPKFAIPDLVNSLPAIIRADDSKPAPPPCLPYGRRERASAPRYRVDETAATRDRATPHLPRHPVPSASRTVYRRHRSGEYGPAATPEESNPPGQTQ